MVFSVYSSEKLSWCKMKRIYIEVKLLTVNDSQPSSNSFSPSQEWYETHSIHEVPHRDLLRHPAEQLLNGDNRCYAGEYDLEGAEKSVISSSFLLVLFDAFPVRPDQVQPGSSSRMWLSSTSSWISPRWHRSLTSCTRCSLTRVTTAAATSWCRRVLLPPELWWRWRRHELENIQLQQRVLVGVHLRVWAEKCLQEVKPNDIPNNEWAGARQVVGCIVQNAYQQDAFVDPSAEDSMVCAVNRLADHHYQWGDKADATIALSGGQCSRDQSSLSKIQKPCCYN